MSAESDASDADRHRDESAVPASSAAVNPDATAPLEPGTTAIDPARQLATAATRTETAAAAVAGRDAGTTASVSAKPQRKTCILKLDGCHYTIGT